MRNGSSALYRMRGERSILSLSIAIIAADFGLLLFAQL